MYFIQSGNFNPDEKVSTDSAYYDVEETEGKIFGISKEGLNSVVDRVRNQRKLDAKENQKNIDDLEQLKTSLQNALSKISNLERDVQPLNEKVKQYKALVNSYEQSAIDQHEKIYSKEKEKKNQLLAINKEYQNVLVDMELKQNEGQHQSRQELISKVTENEVLKQQILSLNSKVQEYKRLSTTSEEELLGKRYDNLREELLKVRNILETSENDRLKERQGKLSVLQNMIVLTKQKSELEGELLTVTKKNSGEKEEEQLHLVSRDHVVKLRKHSPTPSDFFKKPQNTGRKPGHTTRRTDPAVIIDRLEQENEEGSSGISSQVKDAE